ncbi:hypothetical protein TcWFU_004581 [Taenia crassiceps]|uniref:Uncharacterized protein n=1 Tax=Taenia crassiceps TaxID=6207 RepID=A0ABR4Q895_9CEST
MQLATERSGEIRHAVTSRECFCLLTCQPRALAWSSHYKWADCLRVNVASLFLAAVACGLAPLVGRSYNLLVCVGCLFGLFSDKKILVTWKTHIPDRKCGSLDSGETRTRLKESSLTFHNLVLAFYPPPQASRSQ